MNGSGIIGSLLRSDPAMTALVPIASIREALLPGGVSLPTLLVRSISRVEQQPLRRGGMVRVTERISVTVRAESVRSREAAIRQVRRSCAGLTGDIAGALRVSILTAGTGPDLMGPGDSFEKAQDFRVSYDDPA